MSRNISGKRFKNKRHFIMELWGKECAYCGSKRRLNIDHIFPTALGGGSYTFNLCPSCSYCNEYKDKRLLQDFLLDQEEVIDIVLFAYQTYIQQRDVIHALDDDDFEGQEGYWNILLGKLREERRRKRKKR